LIFWAKDFDLSSLHALHSIVQIVKLFSNEVTLLRFLTPLSSFYVLGFIVSIVNILKYFNFSLRYMTSYVDDPKSVRKWWYFKFYTIFTKDFWLVWSNEVIKHYSRRCEVGYADHKQRPMRDTWHILKWTFFLLLFVKIVSSDVTIFGLKFLIVTLTFERIIESLEIVDVIYQLTNLVYFDPPIIVRPSKNIFSLSRKLNF